MFSLECSLIYVTTQICTGHWMMATITNISRSHTNYKTFETLLQLMQCFSKALIGILVVSRVERGPLLPPSLPTAVLPFFPAHSSSSLFPVLCVFLLESHFISTCDRSNREVCKLNHESEESSILFLPSFHLLHKGLDATHSVPCKILHPPWRFSLHNNL
jgi:hypothetical protein